jgi:hypothetical protein
MRTWRHSGFHVDASVKIEADDQQGLSRLLRYMARGAISKERVHYDKKQGKVRVYSSKKKNGKRPIVATYNAYEFLALLCLHIPPKGSHLIRYYGVYSSRTRSTQKKKDQKTSNDLKLEDAPHLKRRKKRGLK